MYVSSLDLDQTHDINHLLGTDAHHQKRFAALFIMKMKETHRLSQVAVDDVVEGSQAVFNHAVGRLQAGVRSKLSALGIDETKVDDIFDSLDDPFKGLETKHMQEKCFKEDLNLVVSNQLCSLLLCTHIRSI